MVNFTKQRIKVVKGTYGYNIPLQALDEDENGIDLTGYTCVWVVKDPQGTTPIFQRLCTSLDITDG